MKYLLLIAVAFTCFKSNSKGSASVVAAQPKVTTNSQSSYRNQHTEYGYAISSYYKEMKESKLCYSDGVYYGEHKTLGAMEVKIKSQSKVNYKDRWFYLSAFKDIECE